MDKYIVTRLYEEPASFMNDKYQTFDDLEDADTEARTKSQEDFQAYTISRYDERENGYHHFMERVAIAVDFELFWQG